MELKLDQWATTPPAGYPGVVAPPLGKRQTGWANGEQPPAAYFNYAFDALADTQNELANLIAAAGLTRAEPDLTQVLTAISKLINRRAERTGITQWLDICNDTSDVQGIATSPTEVIAVVQAATSIRRLTGPSPMWTPIAAGSGYGGVFNDICWSTRFGKFIATGTTSEIQDSANGTVWTRRSNSGGDVFRVVAGADAVVGMSNGGVFRVTTDGTTWTNRSGVWAEGMSALAYSPLLNKFCSVGGYFESGTRRIQLSDNNGANWAAATAVPTGTDVPTNVIWSTRLSCFLVICGRQLLRSSDGLVWTVAAPEAAAPTGFIELVELSEHLLAFYDSMPTNLKVYRLDELNGAPANVLDVSLVYVPSVSTDGFKRVIHIPPDSGLRFAGRLFGLCSSGRIRASHYLG